MNNTLDIYRESKNIFVSMDTPDATTKFIVEIIEEGDYSYSSEQAINGDSFVETIIIEKEVVLQVQPTAELYRKDASPDSPPTYVDLNENEIKTIKDAAYSFYWQ